MYFLWYIYFLVIMIVLEGKIFILDRKLEIWFYIKGGKEKNLVFVILILWNIFYSFL